MRTKMSAPPKKYWITLVCVWGLAAALAFAYLAYGNPMEFGTRKFWLIAQRRADALIAMAIVAVCQAMATVSFHTVTNNRILTPSIMGFESLYVAINTATIFFLGASGLNDARTVPTFLMQMGVMVGLSLVLYSWLLTNRKQKDLTPRWWTP